MNISWTPPPAPPTDGYRISVNPGGLTVLVSSSTWHILEVTELDAYNVSVMSLSSHFPGGTAGPVQVAIRGKKNISLNPNLMGHDM